MSPSILPIRALKMWEEKIGGWLTTPSGLIRAKAAGSEARTARAEDAYILTVWF